MLLKQKLKLCILASFISLLLIIGSIWVTDTNGAYWTIGPNDNLIVVSVKIDTWKKYIGLLAIISLVQIIKIAASEIGDPILGFTIYNPDKKVIKGFTKNEIQILANSSYMISSIRSVFMTVVTLSQIDVALWSVIIAEVTTFFTVRILLNGKKFVEEGYDDIEEKAEMV